MQPAVELIGRNFHRVGGKIPAVPANGDQLCGDADGNFRGGYGGDFKADWGVDPGKLIARHALLAQFVENLMYFPLGSDQPQIGRRRTDHGSEGLRIVAMSAGNDHNISPGLDVVSRQFEFNVAEDALGAGKIDNCGIFWA